MSVPRHNPRSKKIASADFKREIKTTVDADRAGGRLDRLVQELVGGSRSQIVGMLEQSCIERNGTVVGEGWLRLRAGDRVRIQYDSRQRYTPRPRPRSHHGFTVLFEDRDCIVVDKAPELLTIPTRRDERNTLVHEVSRYLKRSHQGREAFVVHRLDRGVSGVLVLGKAESIADALRDQFAGRKPDRRYIAIVAGHLKSAHGTFRSYLATDEDLNRFSTDDEEIGQLAVTHYRVLESLPDATLIEARLETGRRNQIRVHFAEAGHPVLGDPRYGGDAARHPRWRYGRIALHAKSLTFQHPLTNKKIRIESHYPSEMVRFLTEV